MADPDVDFALLCLDLRAIELEREEQGALDAEATTRRAPTDWEPWVQELFPRHVTASFAERHREAWAWAWGIRGPGDAAAPFVGVWPRGGGKSQTAELIMVAVGLRGRRRYGWYVRETQDRANDSLVNIAELLESDAVEEYYPSHARRKLSKYGHSRGWSSQRLRTEGGFTVDAIGLDTAARGLKVGELRPDFIVLDDLDAKHDSPAATAKKTETLTHSILPAGTARTAIVAIQNLIIPHGIFSRLADGRADFLARRIVSGPHPAVEDLKTEIRADRKTGRVRAVITGGRATWEGQDLDDCQAEVDKIGLRAFLQECQHQVHEREGALWKQAIIGHRDEAPSLRRIVVGVDPSGGGDEIGIVAAGEGHDGRYYVLRDATQKGSLGSLNWGRKSVQVYDDLEADRIVAEKNYGGDMVASNIQVAAGEDRRVPVEMVNASRGKAVRAEPVASLYEDGMVDHVGVFPELEQEMTTWVPGEKWSPNRMDALVWVLTKLALTRRKGVARVWFPGMDDENEEGEAA
jgi:hypothetical protein